MSMLEGGVIGSVKEELQVLLEEFKALKTEIGQRSAAQLNLVQINIVAAGSISGAYFAHGIDPRILFLIPIISPILGLLWLDHDAVIRNLGKFIRAELKPEIDRRVGDLPDWETLAGQAETRLLGRFFLLAGPISLTFFAIPLVALLTPFFIWDLKELKEEFALFAIPGGILLTSYATRWTYFFALRPWAERRQRVKLTSA
jgi:hypothetical protein